MDAHKSSNALERPTTALVAGIALLAIYHLSLALLMAFAPHFFFSDIGPFGVRNDHYIRDIATYNAAIGAGLLVAVRRRSWRVPLLAITTLQFALHSFNHLIDIDAAHPTWNGYFDFFSLAVGTAVLAWLWRLAAQAQRDPPEAKRSTTSAPMEANR